MHKLLSSFVLISFVLWILPLGYFIKPSQQKMACDGQRAICMCHFSKSPDKAMEVGIVLKATSSTNKENSGGANDFVSAKRVISLNLASSLFFVHQSFFYQNPSPALLEAVPKI